jgi:hypothetical protein
MNATNSNENLTTGQNIANRCVQSCKKLLTEIDGVKNRIADEFQGTFKSQGQLLQLVLTEAEALARQTAYPHLLFPSLAVEKVQAVAAWKTRQESLYRQRPIFAGAH